MIRHLLILPDGTEIFSGEDTVNAIASIELTQRVNSGVDLTLGSTCAAMVKISLITPQGALSVTAGDEVTLFQVDEQGARQQLGIFILEEPTRPSPNATVLTGYDRITRLDTDVSDWLAGLTGWPYRLADFAKMVCSHCGLTLTNESIPNGDYAIPRFLATPITARRLTEWAAQAAGCFCRATAQGDIEFAWYTPGPVPEYTLQTQYEAYETAPIDAVVIRWNQADPGVGYPEEATGNSYCVTGNGLLTGSAQALAPMARSLYERLQGISYTPCKLVLPTGGGLLPGHSVTLTDPNGKSFSTLIMELSRKGGRDTLTATGNPRRDSTAAVNAQSFQALDHRMTQLRADVDGVSATVSQVRADAREAAAALRIDAQTVDARVSAAEEELGTLRTQSTQLRQQADGLTLSVVEVREKLGEKADASAFSELAEHFRFDAEGLTVSNTATGMGIGVSQERVIFTGGVSPTTVITPNGMTTTDLTVLSRLDLGNFSLLPRTNGNLSLRYTGGA